MKLPVSVADSVGLWSHRLISFLFRSSRSPLDVGARGADKVSQLRSGNTVKTQFKDTKKLEMMQFCRAAGFSAGRPAAPNVWTKLVAPTLKNVNTDLQLGIIYFFYILQSD